MESKRQHLEAKKKRWMQDRELTLAKGKKENVVSPSQIVGSSSRRGPIAREPEPPGGIDESLLNQLTERITKEIKKEITLGLGSSEIRDAMTEKMDKYLESELHSHMCKICSRLMLSPSNTPMLLFPCGHTFCRMCCEKGNRIAVCPYCRHEVQSMTVNQSLKDLIDQFALQREKMRQGSAEVFRPDSHDSSDPRAASRYQAKYRACEMRKEILLNEIRDEREKSLEKILRKKKSLRAAESHLLEERKAVVEKMKLLEEELELIDAHLVEQQTKISEIDELETTSRSAVALLEKSVADIENEMEKLKILASQNVSGRFER